MTDAEFQAAAEEIKNGLEIRDRLIARMSETIELQREIIKQKDEIIRTMKTIEHAKRAIEKMGGGK